MGVTARRIVCCWYTAAEVPHGMSGGTGVLGAQRSIRCMQFDGQNRGTNQSAAVTVAASSNGQALSCSALLLLFCSGVDEFVAQTACTLLCLQVLGHPKARFYAGLFNICKSLEYYSTIGIGHEWLSTLNILVCVNLLLIPDKTAETLQF